MIRADNTEYILSLSYGKDSIACLEAIKRLGYPLDRIIHAEVWATDEIQADLPPMIEFKRHADKIILDRYGYRVEHIFATRPVEREREREKLSFAKQFYTVRHNKKKDIDCIYGFPCTRGQWCTSRLKTDAIDRIRKTDLRENVLSSSDAKDPGETRRDKGLSGSSDCKMVRETQSELFSNSSLAQGANTNIVQYLGIAADEPERVKRHSVPGKILPLVDIGWDEAYCRKWCEENDLLSPIYTSSTRGGCWFCHNQSVDQLRLLRRNYPDLWNMLLKWDNDSPVTFHPDGHTVHDFDKRFQAEDDNIIMAGDRRFKWNKIL